MDRAKEAGFRLGITGGIGSGKTTVCRVFKVLGIPVFSSDKEANAIMESDKELINGINSVVGKDLYITGSLDRPELAALIFNDRSLLTRINHLVHPLVFKQFVRWQNEQKAPYVIVEAAILFESGASKVVDKIVTIVAPAEERIIRVMHRSGLSREQVLERMQNQIDVETAVKQSDYVIYNSENEMIIPAVLKIHEDILGYLNNVN